MKKNLYFTLFAIMSVLIAASCGSKSTRSGKMSKSPTERCVTAIDNFVESLQQVGADMSESDLSSHFKEVFNCLEDFVKSDPSKEDCQLVNAKMNNLSEIIIRMMSRMNRDEEAKWNEKADEAARQAGYTPEFEERLGAEFKALMEKYDLDF